MTRLFSKLALVGLIAGGIVGQTQAETVWRFPYKGAPYAVPHTHANSMETIRRHLHKHGHKKVEKKRKGSVVDTPTIVVAHHKPPYHDDLPRTPGPRNPNTGRFGTSGADAGVAAAAVNEPGTLA